MTCSKCKKSSPCKTKFCLPTGPTGSVGPTGSGQPGPTGPTGSVGQTGPSEVPINQTVFVDLQYGSALGSREDMTNPFQTLAQGLAAALPFDTVYVQPGTYNEDSLVLKDNVNWFFSEGSAINGVNGPVFLDLPGGVTSDIAGYAHITAVNSVLLMSGPSNIVLRADRITVSGRPAFLEVASTAGNSTLELDIVNMESTDTSPMLRTTGLPGATGTNVIVKSFKITGLGPLIDIQVGSVGSATIEAEIMEGGDPGSPSGNGVPQGAVISNNAQNFNLSIETQTLIAHTNTQAIQSSIPAAPGPNERNITSFQGQTLRSEGGVIFSQGTGLVGDPAEILQQPRVNLDCPYINVSVGANVPGGIPSFYCATSIMVVDTNIFEHVAAAPGPSPSFLVEVRQGGVSTFDCDTFLTFTNKGFLMDGTTTTFDPVVMRIDSRQIICNEEFINVFGFALVTVNSNTVQCGSITQGLSPVTIDTDDGVPTVFNVNQITLGTVGISTAFTPLINHLRGELYINCDTYSYNGPYTEGIHSAPGSGASYIEIDNVSDNNGGTDSLFYNSWTQSFVDCNRILVSGNGVLLQGAAEFNPEIDHFIISGGTGTCITAIENSNIIGEILHMSTAQGPAMRILNTGNNDVIFDRIRTDSGEICLEIGATGINGATRMTGNAIDANNCDVGIGLYGGSLALSCNEIRGASNSMYLVDMSSTDLATSGVLQFLAMSTVNAPGIAMVRVTGSPFGFLSVYGNVMSGPGNGILSEGQSIVQVDVGGMFLTGNGIGIETRDQGGFIGQILNLQTNTAPAVQLASVANISLDFNDISTGSGPACINLLGTGDCRLNGNTISCNDCNDGIVVQGGSELSLQVSDINFNGIGNAIFIGPVGQGGGGGCYIDFLHLTSNNGGALHAIHCSGGIARINGQSLMAQGPGILVELDALFYGYFGEVVVNNRGLTITSPSANWYQASSTIVNGGQISDRVVYIDNGLGGSIQTVGGYMFTNGDYDIEFGPSTDSTNRLRLLSSILVSTTNSIVSASNPTVIVAPSSANVPPLNVVIVPAGTLFVDPAVA